MSKTPELGTRARNAASATFLVMVPREAESMSELLNLLADKIESQAAEIERLTAEVSRKPESEQPRTMCNKHGWFDVGPCSYCCEENEEMPICGDPRYDDGAF